MTAKEKLRERIDTLSEDEAGEACVCSTCAQTR
jgi:hypothetical protein